MKPYYDMGNVTLYNGDCRDVLGGMDAESVQCVVTSPPYFGLRNYQVVGQIGLEQTPDAYVAEMVAVFREVRRVLRDDGTLWLNLGDSYSRGSGGDGTQGVAPKNLLGIPWRVAFALQEDGWYLRSDIIWAKPNPMPESVKDRPTRSHEYIFLLTKSARYYYDADAIREPNTPDMIERAARGHTRGGTVESRDASRQDRVSLMEKRAITANGRNKRDVWTIATHPYAAAHFATFPPKLIEPCILAGCPAGGVVLDPFAGAGTTLLVAKNHGRASVGIELNRDYCDLIVGRCAQSVLSLESVVAD